MISPSAHEAAIRSMAFHIQSLEEDIEDLENRAAGPCKVDYDALVERTLAIIEEHHPNGKDRCLQCNYAISVMDAIKEANK